MKTETIRYMVDGKPYTGALVWNDKIATKRPAVLVSPNWMGMTQAAIERGQLVAGDRYVVFVADMYGEGIRPKDFPGAAALANPLRADAMESRKRISGAFETLLAEGNKRGIIDASRKAAVGFCFGGGNVLELARTGVDMAAVVSVHGDLTSPLPAGPGQIKASILAVHGAFDPVSPKAQRDAFETEMEAATKKWQMVVYGSGILHAYTDIGSDVPNIAKYDEHVARQSYDRAHAFIADAFAGRL